VRSSLSRSCRGYLALSAVVIARIAVRRLTVETISSIGGRVACTLGPRTRRHKLALRNIRRAFPDLLAVEHRLMAEEMWNNFGRTIAESLILDRIAEGADRVIFDQSSEALSEQNLTRPTVYAGLHFGNWEMTALPARGRTQTLMGLYKPLKNHRLNAWLLAQRTPLYSAGLLPASRQTVETLAGHIRSGGAVCLLGDHRDRSGLLVPFFGLANPSAIVPALLAIRYGAKLVAARVDRHDDVRFSVHLQEIDITRSGDKRQDVLTMTAALQSTFEQWIRARPGQWMWFSKRWSDSL
jgi:Kdo2-lipid IVA lauroyltransferase/acyltransferase